MYVLRLETRQNARGPRSQLSRRKAPGASVPFFPGGDGYLLKDNLEIVLRAALAHGIKDALRDLPVQHGEVGCEVIEVASTGFVLLLFSTGRDGTSSMAVLVSPGSENVSPVMRLYLMSTPANGDLARFSSRIISHNAAGLLRLRSYLQQNDGVERSCTISSVRHRNECHREKTAY